MKKYFGIVTLYSSKRPFALDIALNVLMISSFEKHLLVFFAKVIETIFSKHNCFLHSLIISKNELLHSVLCTKNDYFYFYFYS